ncbi:MAG: hypothetical protein INF91_12505 [Alphaproteobacteria bacterium]|nr:hypothetical protein [Alphaproteobacteria bacterium]
MLGALGVIGWMFNNWVRARHGYPLEDDNGNPVLKLDDKRFDMLAAENEKLKAAQLRLEERIAVLERIATDPGQRIAQQIEALR